MPKSFWAEAVNWVFYVLNRSPTVAVKDVTPQEAWSGIKPSVHHFRIWGCLAHAHVPRETRTKLDKRSVTCIFLGISEHTKGYRLFNVETDKLFISRDVVFAENEQWQWSKEYDRQLNDALEWPTDEPEPVISTIDEGVQHDNNNEGVLHDNNNVENNHGMQNAKAHAAVDGMQNARAAAESVAERVDSHVELQEMQETRIVDSGTNQPVHVETWIRRVPHWMNDYVSGDCISDDALNMTMTEDCFCLAALDKNNTEDPICFTDAVTEAKWRDAMDSEIKSIEKNNTWSLTVLPKGARRIGVKWVYKTKRDENGHITKHKARLVAKGYVQKQGVDFTEVFAPVARLDTVRMIISLAAQRGWTLLQLDVKSAFLHGTLQEQVFVEQPQGYEKKGQEHMVYQLHKALYGLRQAPRAWYSCIRNYFIKNAFSNV